MKTIDDIRRARLKQLADENGGVGALAAKIQRDASQVSQWINGSINSGTGKPRTMRSESCRQIEEATGKPQGWLDREVDLVVKNQDGSMTLIEAKTSPKSSPPRNSDLDRAVELMRLYALVSEDLRPRVFKAVRGVIINLGGISEQDSSAADEL